MIVKDVYKRQSLNNRPVVVLSNNDGCIVARSNEVKELGIKMGQSLYESQELIEKQMCIRDRTSPHTRADEPAYPGR